MATTRMLIINPNTTQSMTDGLKRLVDSLGYNELTPENTIHYFTALSGPASIDNDDDALESATACYNHIAHLARESAYEGYLVACYSHHPLVWRLREITNVPVIGIFEASIATALQLLSSNYSRPERFGIVSTGKVWERLLGSAVLGMLGSGKGDTGTNERFAGVETTGLNATELHSTPQEEVKRRIKEAARRLMARGNVKVVILGCAGMAGMDEWVREEASEDVKIVDGVKAGVGNLLALIKGKF